MRLCHSGCCGGCRGHDQRQRHPDGTLSGARAVRPDGHAPGIPARTTAAPARCPARSAATGGRRSVQRPIHRRTGTGTRGLAAGTTAAPARCPARSAATGPALLPAPAPPGGATAVGGGHAPGFGPHRQRHRAQLGRPQQGLHSVQRQRHPARTSTLSGLEPTAFPRASTAVADRRRALTARV